MRERTCSLSARRAGARWRAAAEDDSPSVASPGGFQDHLRDLSSVHARISGTEPLAEFVGEGLPPGCTPGAFEEAASGPGTAERIALAGRQVALDLPKDRGLHVARALTLNGTAKITHRPSPVQRGVLRSWRPSRGRPWFGGPGAGPAGGGTGRGRREYRAGAMRGSDTAREITGSPKGRTWPNRGCRGGSPKAVVAGSDVMEGGIAEPRRAPPGFGPRPGAS